MNAEQQQTADEHGALRAICCLLGTGHYSFGGSRPPTLVSANPRPMLTSHNCSVCNSAQTKLSGLFIVSFKTFEKSSCKDRDHINGGIIRLQERIGQTFIRGIELMLDLQLGHSQRIVLHTCLSSVICCSRVLQLRYFCVNRSISAIPVFAWIRA